jgi:hypothetical protein
MCAEFRSITLENMPHAVYLMRECSRGMSLEYDLDTVGFLTLARFWNFCYEQSLITYIDNEPAALAIHCTDPGIHEAYTYYWGVLPKFRNLRISLQLAEACARKLRAGGYATVLGDTVPDRPVRRWRFVHFYPQDSLLDMQAQEVQLPPVDASFRVRETALDTVSQIAFPPHDRVHWCQRRSFLGHAASFLKFVGSFKDHVLAAYAVLVSKPSETMIWDLRCPESSLSAGYELLRWIADNCPPPFNACYAFDGSYSHRVLANCGFSVKRTFYSVMRDLLTTT